MQIGDLRRRIAILKPITERDTYGAVTQTYAEQTKVWAEIIPIKGAETFDDNQIKTGRPYKITCRYVENLDEKCRIRYGKKLFEITSVIDDTTLHRWSIVYAKEIENAVI